MREYSLYSVTGIDDRILQIWIISLYDLDEIQTDEELIYASHERIICKMKPWMNWFISKCFYVQFLLLEVCIIFLSEGLELPKKGGFICIHHSMSYLFENSIGFSSWIFQEVSIYGSYLVCLAELYGCIMVVFLYSCIYSIPSINHSKEGWRVS